MDIREIPKNITFSDFLERLNVSRFGKKGAELVSEKIKNLATLRYLIETDKVGDALMTVPGIGEKTRDALLERLLDIDFILTLEEMEDQKYEIFEDLEIHEIKIQTEEEKVKEIVAKPVETDGIANLNFVITGTLSKHRDEYVRIIESNGAKVQNAVNTKTNYLLIGDKGEGTTKHRKALALGVKIITEKEFWNLCR